jgi:hypothetical protein
MSESDAGNLRQRPKFQRHERSPRSGDNLSRINRVHQKQTHFNRDDFAFSPDCFPISRHKRRRKSDTFSSPSALHRQQA